MAVGQIGQNSANEFFETILYGVGYDEARKQIEDFTKEVDNPIVKDAIQSAMNVLVFGFMMIAIQKQEALIAKIFDIAETIVWWAVLKTKNAFNSIKGKKGTKLYRALSFLQGKNSEDLAIAQVAVTHQGFKGFSRASSNNNETVNNYSTLQAVNDTKNTLYNRENLHMQMGNAMASRYNETLLFKLFTKSFTPSDETLIKKILGRESSAVLNVNDLNQVADFLFVKDSTGKILGLSEAFFSLVNGLGYVHNKA